MDWDRLTLVTAPTDFPVSLADAKAHLRVDYGDDDAYITGCIARAVATIDGPTGIGRCLMSQSWLLALDLFPPEITIPLGPVSAITSIKYLDQGGVEQTLDPTAYWANLKRSPATICPAYNASWPLYRSMPGAIKVQFVAGSAISAIPADLKAAVLLLVGHYYQNREAVMLGDAGSSLALGVENIISKYRAGVVA